MRPRPPAAVTLATVAVAVSACGDAFEVTPLHARCEIPIRDTSCPVVDPFADPERYPVAEQECEVWLYFGDEAADGTGGRLGQAPWSREGGSGFFGWLPDCANPIWVDPAAVVGAEEVFMVCLSTADRCEELATVENRRCELPAEGPLRLGEGSSVAGVVETEGGVAALWTDDDEAPHVTFLSVAGGGLAVAADVEPCGPPCGAPEGPGEDCRLLTVEAAARGASVLLPGLCGAKALVEVSPEGTVAEHSVVPAEEAGGPTPAAVLAAVDGESGLVALWTDGRNLWSTTFTEASGSLEPGEPVLAYRPEQPLTRRGPAGACWSAEGARCVATWEHVLLDGPVGPSVLDRRGVGWLYLDGSPDARGAPLTAAEDAIVAVGPEPRGIVVSREPTLGMLARIWDGTGALPAVLSDVHQLGHGGRDDEVGWSLSRPTAVAVGGAAFAVAWWADTAGGSDQTLRLALTAVAEASGLSSLVYPAELVPPRARALDGDGGAPPLLAVELDEGMGSLLAGGLVTTSGSPDTATLELALAGGLVSSGRELPRPEEVVRLSSAPVEVGSVAGCRGDAGWLGDRFVMIVPTDEGLVVAEASREPDGTPRLATEPLPTTAGMSTPCNATLWTGDGSGADAQALAVFDTLDPEGGPLWGAQARIDTDGGVVWGSPSRLEGAAPRARGPRFAAGDEPLLLYEGSASGAIASDVLAARVAFDPATGALEASSVPMPDSSAAWTVPALVLGVSLPDDRVFVVQVRRDLWSLDAAPSPVAEGFVAELGGWSADPVQLLPEGLAAVPTSVVGHELGPAGSPSGRYLSVALGLPGPTPETRFASAGSDSLALLVEPGAAPEPFELQDDWMWVGDFRTGGEELECLARSVHLAAAGPHRAGAAIFARTCADLSGAEVTTLWLTPVDPRLHPTARPIALSTYGAAGAGQPNAGASLRDVVEPHLGAALTRLTADDSFVAVWTEPDTVGQGASVEAMRVGCAP